MSTAKPNPPDPFKALTEAHRIATDRVPPGTPQSEFSTYSTAYLALMQAGLEGLGQLSVSDQRALFEGLQQLDVETLRWALAQAVRELHEAGWTPLGEEEDS